MTYKETIAEEMRHLANKGAYFIGYNTAYGHRMYDTLTPCPLSSTIETPVAENLMTGLAMGMSLEGYFSVLCFERSDFLLPAMDAILNHLDKLPIISGEQFNFNVLVRVVVGDTKPLNPGLQHCQDYTAILERYCINTEVCYLMDNVDIKEYYHEAYKITRPRICVEYKCLYNS